MHVRSTKGPPNSGLHLTALRAAAEALATLGRRRKGNVTRTRRAPPIERALAECAPPVVFASMSPDETSALQQRWRESFATRVKAATGTWIYNGFDWHAFSYEFVYCRRGDKAIAEYQACRAPRFCVLPHLDDEPGYWCESEQLPALHGRDAYVCDPDFTWTMAFTHEEDWCGPYFTTRDWAEGREPNKPKLRR